jgi:hypothetical protein
MTLINKSVENGAKRRPANASGTRQAGPARGKLL